MFPVSVVILTKDEEENIEDALKMEAALKLHLSGAEVRESVRHLDFVDQLKKLVEVCICAAG